MVRTRPEWFATSRWWRWPSLAAAWAWGAFLSAAAGLGLADARLVVSASFFVVLFAALSVAYARTGVGVDAEGLVCRGLLGSARVRFGDVVRAEVRRGVFGTRYLLQTRRGPVAFSSSLRGHRRLFDLIVARASLGP